MTRTSSNAKREAKKNGWFFSHYYKYLHKWRKHEKAATHHVMWWWPNKEDQVTLKKSLQKSKPVL